jgi:cysteine desulfuration protein SufE
MSTIAQRQAEVLEEFQMFPTWMEKYEYIIELGKELEGFPESERRDENIISGCQSKVWLTAQKLESGLVHFHADSDAIITKGMVSLMLRIFNDQLGSDIVAADMNFLTEIGLLQNLSQTRSNGLASMIKQIKTYGFLLQ